MKSPTASSEPMTMDTVPWREEAVLVRVVTKPEGDREQVAAGRLVALVELLSSRQQRDDLAIYFPDRATKPFHYDAQDIARLIALKRRADEVAEKLG